MGVSIQGTMRFSQADLSTSNNKGAPPPPPPMPPPVQSRAPIEDESGVFDDDFEPYDSPEGSPTPGANASVGIGGSGHITAGAQQPSAIAAAPLDRAPSETGYADDWEDGGDELEDTKRGGLNDSPSPRDLDDSIGSPSESPPPKPPAPAGPAPPTMPGAKGSAPPGQGGQAFDLVSRSSSSRGGGSSHSSSLGLAAERRCLDEEEDENYQEDGYGEYDDSQGGANDSTLLLGEDDDEYDDEVASATGHAR